MRNPPRPSPAPSPMKTASKPPEHGAPGNLSCIHRTGRRSGQNDRSKHHAGDPPRSHYLTGTLTAALPKWAEAQPASGVSCVTRTFRPHRRRHRNPREGLRSPRGLTAAGAPTEGLCCGDRGRPGIVRSIRPESVTSDRMRLLPDHYRWSICRQVCPQLRGQNWRNSRDDDVALSQRASAQPLRPAARADNGGPTVNQYLSLTWGHQQQYQHGLARVG